MEASLKKRLGDYVRECTEQSLSNLGLDTIDVQQFHVWQDDWLGGDWLEVVEDLKEKVRSVLSASP